MKTLKHLFTALLLLCSTVVAAHGFYVDGIYYNITDATNKKVEVTYRGNSYSDYSDEYTGNVVIPESVTYNGTTYSVTSIDSYAFSGCTGLTSITISNSVTSIGERAFEGCTWLKSVTIPNSVTSIGYNAFYACTRLTSVEFNAEYCTTMGGGGNYPVFKGCSALSTITIGENVQRIPSYAFSGCTKIESVVIHNSVTSIGDYAFYDCYGLTSVEIPNSVTSIGDHTFYNCTGLTSIEIPNSVTSIGNNAFNKCSNIDEVHISDIAAWCSISFVNTYSNPIRNGTKLFLNGKEPNELIIPNNVSRISDYAFYNCENLYSVTIGSSVTEIGVSSLPSGIKKVIFLGNTPPRTSADKIYKPANAKMIYVSNADSYGYGIEYGRLSSMFEVGGVKYVPLSTKECEVIDSRYNSSAANVSVDSVVTYKNRMMTVKNINDYAFYGNDNIKQVYVNNDGYVGDSCFFDCDSIAGDLVVENNGYIGDHAFYSCDAIENAVVSNNGYIGESAFQGCINLVTAHVSNNGYIGESAFAGSFTQCSDESSLEVLNTSYIGNSAFQGCTNLVTANVANNGNIGNQAFQNCTSLANLSLGEDVDSLGNYAFDNCASLKEFSIPDYIPSMGEYCFRNCSSLTRMAVGAGVKTLNRGTFQNCTALTDMSIGVNVYSIKNSVFNNCFSLPAINIPQATKNVADNVFYDCGSLSLVVFENRADSIVLGSNSGSPMFSSCPLDSVYVGGRLSYNTTESKGYSPFYGNKYLRSITYNDVETNIYDKEFMNCSNLQNVHLGNGIEKIGAEAFRNCTSLPRITTPNSVTTMGKYVFSGCSSLQNAIIGNGTNSIQESSFLDCISLTNITLGTSIASIKNSSFRNCRALPEITIPAATTVIADSVFKNCKSLARFYVVDGDMTLTMGKNAANAASGKIGDNCPLFYDCKLDSVYLGRNLSYNQTQEYGYSPFYFNSTLRAVVIGDSVKSVFPNEFYQCRKLEYVSVGNGVTSVGNWAFSSCVSLDHFSFGVGLENIGKEAFSDCTLVTKIVSSRNVPPVCGDQALADIDMWECTVYVPEDYIDAYMDAPQWCEFWIEGAEYTITYMVGDEKYSEATIKYGAEIELPVEPVKEGYTFIGWKDILAVMPAYDMTVHAEFKANDYTVTYIVDGEVYDTAMVACDSEIIPIVAPEKDGYTFNRWENLPATMPAGDIEVTAVYDEIPTEVTITIGKYGSATYSSAYALDFTNVAGLNAYAATGYNTNTGVITMTRVMTSSEGTGLFLKGAPGTYVVPIIESSDDNSLNMLAGVMEPTIVNSVSDDGLYANYRYMVKSGTTVPMFYRYTDGSSIGAGKAYLQIPLEWLPLSPMESISFRFDDGETTDIDEVTEKDADTTVYYDLNGRIVTNPVKGIYIVNGKKVYVE